MNLLDPEAYTIAWIAPLEIEARAAVLLLDKRHLGRFLMSRGDSYIYEAGELCGHNVIIATLPVGQEYGTGPVAALARQVKNFFPRLRLCLLVGVGAGLPNLQRDPPIDIRLGDVLVALPEGENAGLIPYDLAKETGEHGFQPLRLGHGLFQTDTLILSAITDIKLEEADTDLILPYYKELREKDGHNLFADPGQKNDRFYQIDDNESKLPLPREQRPDTMRTRVWYGPIGCGEELIKNAQKRNELRDRYNIIGLARGAAGIMDCIPVAVGVILGVCDYGDEHKNKPWQPHAAAMAASYAKAVLARVAPRVVAQTERQAIPTTSGMPSRRERALGDESSPTTGGKAKAAHIANPEAQFSHTFSDQVSDEQSGSLNQDQTKALLDSLKFDRIESRHDSIKSAYGKTCEWLSRTPQYLDWLEPNKLHEHHGFLWIKGNPGAGKSTLMKYALYNAEKTKKTSCISFFFDARGDYLEKSTNGMYRSLLFQLLNKLPRLQSTFNSLGRTVRNGNISHWSSASLKSLFKQAIQNLEQSPVTCFIDALDECDESEIRDMISFFDTLGEMAVSRSNLFRVCLSSRFYPYITISRGLHLDLGKQEGHDQAIVTYVNGKLKIGSSKLAQQVCSQLIENASGIFIWVILGVHILQREYDHGRVHTLLQRLRDIHEYLNDLFRDILSRDNRHKDELLLCIQWVLFARQPLRQEQLYPAVLVGVDAIAASSWHPKEDEDAEMNRFIISASRGLVEVSKSTKNPKVQFFHESAREFFLKDGWKRIWPELKGNFRGESHERLKQFCVNYMSIVSSSLNLSSRKGISMKEEVRESTRTQFPFLEYAFRTVLYHAEEAAAFGVDQAAFLHDFDLTGWKRFEAIFEQHHIRQHSPTTSLLYILAEHNAAKLIECHPDKLSGFKLEEGDERYGMPILAAVATNSRRAVYALLNAQADAEEASPLHSLCEQYDQNANTLNVYTRHFQYSKTRTVFLNLVAAGDEQVVAFAIASAKLNITIDWDGAEGANALRHAARIGYDTIVRLLLSKGVDVDVASELSIAPLHLSAKGGHESIVRLLLERGANPEAVTSTGQTPLHFAAQGGNETVVQLLLDTGADPEAVTYAGQTPLRSASQTGHEAIVRLLLDRGANIYRSNPAAISSSATIYTSHPAAVPSSSTWQEDKQITLQSSLPTEDSTFDDSSDKYSDAGSFADWEEEATEEFASWVTTHIASELQMTSAKVLELLPELCREFAIRLGHEGKDREHREVMYIAHKPAAQRAIAKALHTMPAEGGGEISRRSSSTEESSVEGGSEFLPMDRKPVAIRDGQPGMHYREKVHDFLNQSVLHQSEVHLSRHESPLPVGKYTPHHQVLKDSKASAWLLAALQRDLTLHKISTSSMGSVRNTVLRVLRETLAQEAGRSIQAASHRVSRKRNPQTQSAHFKVRWTPMAFLQHECSDGEFQDPIQRAMTLTGEPGKLQALPCQDYMEQTWPCSMANLLLVLLKSLVLEPQRSHESRLDYGSSITVRIEDDCLYAETEGTVFEIAEVAEQLAWLGSALQPTHQPGYSNCHPVIRQLPLADRFNSVGADTPNEAFFSIEFVMSPPTFGDIERAAGSQCWAQLFDRITIAGGFPIPSRPESTYGLEIPLHIAATIIGAQKVVPFKDRLVIKGFATMLYSSKVDPENGIISWHLIENKDGSRISYADPRVGAGRGDGVNKLHYGEVETARNIIGWCRAVEIITGTSQANDRIQASATQPPPRGWILEKMQISAGKYIVFGATFARGRRTRPFNLRRTEKDDYIGRLERLHQTNVILHDTGCRRAWFVDGPSALLYISRASLSIDSRRYQGMTNSYATALGLLHEPEALSGKATSLQVLENEQNLKLVLRRKGVDGDYTFQNRVLEIMDCIELIADSQMDMEPNEGIGFHVSRSPWKHLHGFDFRDVAAREDNISAKFITLTPDAEGWVGFSRAVHAITLFGQGFGDLLRPVNEGLSCQLCHWNCQPPSGRDLLAVSMADLEYLHLEVSNWSEDSGGKRSVTGGFTWPRPASSFAPCSCPSGEAPSTRIQRFSKTSELSKSFRIQGRPEPEIGRVSRHGALLLGMPSKTVQKRKALTPIPLQTTYPSRQRTRVCSPNLYDGSSLMPTTASTSVSSSDQQPSSTGLVNSSTITNSTTYETQESEDAEMEDISQSPVQASAANTLPAVRGLRRKAGSGNLASSRQP